MKLAVVRKAVRQVRTYGPGMLVERFVRCKEILSTPPFPCDPNSVVEVHMQVCNRDWLNAFWTLKSLRKNTDASFALFIYLDFNVPEEARGLFESHFPGVNIPCHDSLDEQVRAKLAPKAPTLAALWRAHFSPTLYKMVNAWLCAAQERILYLDPDVLFFAPPGELIGFVRNATQSGSLGIFNVTSPPPVDLADPGAFCFDESDVRSSFGLTLPREFNAGMAALFLPALDWALLEEAVRRLRWLPDRALLVDQTLLAMLAARSGWKQLDRSRYIVDEGTLGSATVASHYFGSSRRGAFYAEGIPAVRARGLLSNPD